MLTFGGVQLHECTATAAGGASLGDFEAAFQFAVLMQRHSPWWLGDLMSMVDRRFGDRGAQAFPQNFSLDHLQRCKGISQRVPRDHRSRDLSWQHHIQAARVPPHEQTRILARASRLGLNSNELRMWVSSYLKGIEEIDET